MYNPEQRKRLLQLASDSIEWGLKHGKPLPVSLDEFEQALQQDRACFVTLHENNQLRGCIGTLEAHQPLVKDISDNAFNAAFRDPRFNALQAEEKDRLKLSISVLTPSTAMTFSSEQDLIEQIEPGVDGLILQDGYRRGTFLPSVWEQLPDKKQFLQHLKLKAGLAADHWSDSIQVSRYHTESFEYQD
jgi:AmmeMemoRadiSam system protein A